MLLAELHLELLAQTWWWLAIALLASAALALHGLLHPTTRARSLLVSGATAALSLLATWRSQALLPLLVTASACTATVYLLYRTSPLPRRRRLTLTTLRTAALLAMLLLLFRPVLALISGHDAAKPTLAIVLDASASMGYNDAPNQPNRYRQSALAVTTTLIPRLASTYHLSLFAYDGKHTVPLTSPADLDTIAPDAPMTDLGAALASAAAAPSDGGKLAGLLLFSDGIHNGPTALDAELAKLGGGLPPTHTIRVGSSDLEPSAVPDIAVTSIDGPQSAIVNNAVTLTAAIKSTAMSDRTVRVALLEKLPDGSLKQLDEQRLVLRSGAIPQSLPLKFTPDKVGRMTVRVQVPVDPAERSDVNNQQDFSLLVTDPKLSVLYVEGRVRPEVGPLRRTLEQDPNLSAISLVQTAPGRFELSGTQRNDELKGLPTTLQQWKRFKVVILGDLDASFLSAQQQKDLEQAVREGTGLLMIGGQNSFAPGNWNQTALANVLPVTLDKVTPPQINTPFVPKLTALGAAHPIFRNIATYFLAPDGSKAATTVPDLSGCVALKSAKPGATVLAIHPTAQVDGQPAIVLAVQQYAKGRTAAFAADTTWRWSLFLRAMQKDSPYNRFWGQTVRWLAAEENLEKKTGSSVTAMLAKERFEAAETVPLRAAVVDTQGQATNYATAWADVTGPDGHSARVDLAPRNTADEGQPGIYQGTFKPAMAGPHKVTFHASKENADLGRDDSSFTVLAAAGERDVLAAQPRTLELIARTTGGTAVDLSGLDALADRLLATAPRAPTAAATTIPLYHPRGYFLLFIACLTTEWLLRRRWQLQ